jgi:hypothetical protein
MNFLCDCDERYRKIVKRDNKKLCRSTISIEEKAMVAQPGMAASVKNFIPVMIRIPSMETIIINSEKISSLVAMISIKTPIAPSPCMRRAVKLILEEPSNRLPLWVGTVTKGTLVLSMAPARWFHISLV